MLEWIDYPERIGGIYSLTLLEVKDGVVAEKNRLVILSFSCLLVLLPVFVDLPEDDLGSVLSFLDVSAQGLGLAIGNPVARPVALRGEKENIDAAVFLLADKFAGGSVRQGLRQGATPDSSCLMMDSVTISYAVGICVLLLYVWISFGRTGSTIGLN